MTDDHSIIPVKAEVVESQDLDILHPMVRVALAHSPTVETIRELQQLQREHEAHEARKSFTRSLTAMQSDLPAVIDRDQRVRYGQTSYTHTSLAHAVEVITPVLAEYGFARSWRTDTTGKDVVVTCRLTHRDGHTEETTMSAPPDNKGGKGGPQSVASSVTMLQRYTLLALLGIATGDMREPVGSAPDVIDKSRTMKWLAWLEKTTRSVKDAEKFIGKPSDQWTVADCDRLREMAK